MRLANERAIVTGGASGFGEGIVRRFLAEGAKVAIADLDEAKAKALADELGPACIAVRTDVADGASSTAMARVAAIIQPLDALYQARFGRGLTPPVEAMFRIAPCLAAFIAGTPQRAV